MGAYTAAKHLIDLGHREIAFMIGPINLSSSLAYIDGYKQAMLDSGLQWQEDHLHIGPQTTIEEGQKAFQKFWQLNPHPTAVASGSDFMAAGLMRTAQKSGVRIPEDLSIIGYDDIPLSSLLTPPLTTILQDKDKLGEEAVRLLLKSMKSGKKEFSMITIPPELVIRESTAPYHK
jgi:DNA-binding LacI/PurR family transcriptional regulator